MADNEDNEDNAQLSDVSRYFSDLQKWSYRCEGSWTMVLSLRKLKTVLRLRKRECKNSIVEADPDSRDYVREILCNLEFVKNVILPLIGDHYVRVGKVISVREGFAASMNEICRGLRPEHRLDKEIDENCSFGVVMPDFCFLPSHRIASPAKENCVPEIETKNPTFSVEIKPKCGFLPTSTYIDSSRETKYSVCHYCMLQKSKVKQEKYKRESNYCPLDLFSADAKRVMYALQCLVSDPQNNLRVFCDGNGIFTEELVQGAIQNGRVCCSEKHFEMALQQTKFLTDNVTIDNECGNNVTRHGDCVTTGGCKMEDCMTMEGDKCGMTTNDKCGDNVTTEPHKCGHVGPFSRKFLDILLEILVDDSKTNMVQASNVKMSPTTLSCKRSKYLESNANIQRLNSLQFGNGGVLQKLLLVQKLDDIDVEGIYPLYKRVACHFECNPGLRDNLGVDGPFTLPLWKTVASTLSNIPDRITATPTSPVLNAELSDPHKLNDAVIKICKFAVAATAKDCSIMLAFQKSPKKEAWLPAVEMTCGDLYHYSIDLVDLDPKEFDRVLKYYKDTKKTVEIFLEQ